MNESPVSIESAEQEVVEAKAQVRAEYRAVESKVRRSASSPLLVGGVLLGAAAIGYLALGERDKGVRAASREKRGAWREVLRIAQMLLPLLGAQDGAGSERPGAKRSHAPRHA
jgi:hypothetical protein